MKSILGWTLGVCDGHIRWSRACSSAGDRSANNMVLWNAGLDRNTVYLFTIKKRNPK